MHSNLKSVTARSKAQTLDHYRNVEAAARNDKSLIGALQVKAHVPTYGRRCYTLTGAIEQYSDRELLAYVHYTPEFGGRVERMPGVAYVTVHTD